ncbi:hypothetical protein EDB85DRAFT_2274598 [Lactarius pseudohatsudake]|nr:hypothetical protein EDB85DRAFT_2274598 [Lactarius pseudohatsudake]
MGRQSMLWLLMVCHSDHDPSPRRVLVPKLPGQRQGLELFSDFSYSLGYPNFSRCRTVDCGAKKHCLSGPHFVRCNEAYWTGQGCTTSLLSEYARSCTSERDRFVSIDSFDTALTAPAQIAVIGPPVKNHNDFECIVVLKLVTLVVRMEPVVKIRGRSPIVIVRVKVPSTHCCGVIP